MIRHRLTISPDGDGHLAARPFWRRGKVLTLTFTEPGLVVTTDRAPAGVTLPWAAFVPDGSDGWAISWWTSGQAGMFGVAVVVHGVLVESTAALASATRTPWRSFDLRRSGHDTGVALPVLPGSSEFSRYQAERGTLAALCHVLRDRTDLRHRLEQPVRMERLAREMQRDLLPPRTPPAHPARGVADVLAAMRQAGYVHRFGRPLSRADVERSSLVVDEVCTRIMFDPHRLGRPVDTALVDRVVRSHYLDVRPWPFAALTGPV